MKVPTSLHTEEQQEALRSLFKAAGYGHWNGGRHGANVTNMKRGVRITIETAMDPKYLAHGLIHSFIIELRTTSHSKTKTHYVQQRAQSIIIDNAGHEEQVRLAFEKIIEKADNLKGQEAIKDLRRGILQNLVLEDLKDRLKREQPRLDIRFGSKSGDPENPSSLRINLPPIKKTNLRPKKAQSAETRKVNSKALYLVDELVIYLSDGKIKFLFGDFHHPRFRKDTVYFIPSFSDPSFDPETIYAFAINALERMRETQRQCVRRQNEIDRLHWEIAQEKDSTRDDFSTIWDIACGGDGAA
jgi:hypothetical protein